MSAWWRSWPTTIMPQENEDMMDRVRKYNLSTGYLRPLQTRYCSLRHTTRCCLRIKSIAFPIHWTRIPKDEVYFKFVLSGVGGCIPQRRNQVLLLHIMVPMGTNDWRTNTLFFAVQTMELGGHAPQHIIRLHTHIQCLLKYVFIDLTTAVRCIYLLFGRYCYFYYVQ